jgi:ATP/ADP translocase
MSKFMLLYTCSFQILGLVFALFGTSQIKRFGVKTCLLVMPLLTIVMAFLPIAYPQLITLWIVQVVLRALNYSFNQPLREMLFIPTVKDIQFTSKAWIDSFGRTISKASGSGLNVFAVQASYLIIVCQSLFAVGLAITWAFAGVLVGKKYVKTILNNQVIGGK